MSTEQFPSKDKDRDNTGLHGGGNDAVDNGTASGPGDVVEALRAFGLTLESEVDGSIRPAPASVTDRDNRRPRLIAWLAAAALLVTAGFGLGVIWRDRSASIDSVGESSVEDGQEASTDDSQNGAQDDPEGDASDTTENDATVEPEEDEAEPPPATPDPSTIVGADGSKLVVVVGTESALGERAPTSREDVVLRAVVDELLRLDAFTDLDRGQLAELLATGGLTVETTLDPSVHDGAIAAIDELYPNTDGLSFEPGVITINNRNDSIVAISSRDPVWDGLVSEPRQPGSAFKSLVLAQAYEDGVLPNDLVRADGPCTFPAPDDDSLFVGGSYRPPQSIAAVTRSSNNCAFVRLGQVVGNERVVELAGRLGLELSPDPVQLMSLPLGVVPVSAIDMTGAYAAFSNDGLFEEPWLVARVIDREGSMLYEHSRNLTRAMESSTARMVTDTLWSNVTSGTGKNAQLSSGHAAAGKTGTTHNSNDAWFIGYTNDYTSGVWLGDTGGNRRIRIPGWNSFGGGLPAAIWGAQMEGLQEALPPMSFPEYLNDEGSDPRLLEVDGEISLCDNRVPSGPVEELEAIDTDGDGAIDCFRPILID